MLLTELPTEVLSSKDNYPQNDYLTNAVINRVTMMKFKSLFRRGQPSQQQAAQQQQPASLRQAPSASSLEAKSDVSTAGNNWAGSLGSKEPARSKATTAAAKGSAKASRMQELEREIEALRKDRARLEANLRDAASDVQNLRELRAELVSLKVSFEKLY